MALMNDDRHAAKALNDLMNNMQNARHGPNVEREVEFFPRVYVFGHYDSRGGATLIMAKNVVEAIQKYCQQVGWTDNPDFDYDNAYEDLQNQGVFQLVVCDEKLPTEPTDLLDGFSDDGYKSGTIQYRYELHEGGHSEWEDTDVRVLWKPKMDVGPDDYEARYLEDAPKLLPSNSSSALKFEYRLVEWDPGEDACGLAYEP